MFQPDVVVHPTDFSDTARGAFRYALHLARANDASLHLLHVVATLGVDPIRGAFEAGVDEEAFFQKMEDEANQHMQALLDEAKDAGVSVMPVLRRHGDVDEAICDYAEEQNADVLVMGTHGRRALSRILLGSVAESVVHRAPCSVLTVGEAADEADPDGVERVLTPIDLSEYTVPLLKSARQVATAFRASIDVLHVVEPLPIPVPLIGGFTLNDLVTEPVHRAEKEVQAVLDHVGIPAEDARSHVEEGHAATVILDVADDLDADLICIASHGLSGMTRLLVGSVTARVVRRAPCPVLTLRLPAEEIEAERERLEAASDS